MKKFLECFVIFIIPIIIILIPIEYLLRQLPNPYTFKYEWMQNNAKNVEVLVFGSSHSFYGIRPEFIDGVAFNLANPSQGLQQDYNLLKYWANEYKHLNTIICPISAFSFFDDLEKGNEAYRCRYYKIYMDFDMYPDISWYNLELSHLSSAQVKISKLLTDENDIGCDSCGWCPSYTLSKKNLLIWNDGSEAKAAAMRHSIRRPDLAALNYQYLKYIADFCITHKIRMILVTTPCWHTYCENLDKNQLSEMYSLIHKLQKGYNLQYLDYLNDDRFVSEDFYDSNHLSDIGAAKFSKQLNEDIKKLHYSYK